MRLLRVVGVAAVGHLVLVLTFSSCSSGPSDVTVGRVRGVTCSALSCVAGLWRCESRRVLGRWGQREKQRESPGVELGGTRCGGLAEGPWWVWGPTGWVCCMSYNGDGSC